MNRRFENDVINHPAIIKNEISVGNVRGSNARFDTAFILVVWAVYVHRRIYCGTRLGIQTRNGGPDQIRTGVDGFAIRWIASLPPGRAPQHCVAGRAI